MMQEDIIRMAREAGIRLASQSDTVDPRNVYSHEIERFAALVAAHEREECAKVCVESEIRFEELCDKFAYPYDQGSADASRELAAAIRARGEK